MKIKATWTRFDKNNCELNELTCKYNNVIKSVKWKKVDKIADAFTVFIKKLNYHMLHYHIKQ